MRDEDIRKAMADGTVLAYDRWAGQSAHTRRLPVTVTAEVTDGDSLHGWMIVVEGSKGGGSLLVPSSTLIGAYPGAACAHTDLVCYEEADFEVRRNPETGRYYVDHTAVVGVSERAVYCSACGEEFDVDDPDDFTITDQKED